MKEEKKLNIEIEEGFIRNQNWSRAANEIRTTNRIGVRSGQPMG